MRVVHVLVQYEYLRTAFGTFWGYYPHRRTVRKLKGTWVGRRPEAGAAQIKRVTSIANVVGVGRCAAKP